MQLEDGKTYVTGYGEKVTVRRRHLTVWGDPRYPFISDSGATYTESGDRLIAMPSRMDLVSLWEDPATDKPTQGETK
jgi:hypothetical protein